MRNKQLLLVEWLETFINEDHEDDFERKEKFFVNEDEAENFLENEGIGQDQIESWVWVTEADFI